MAIHKGIRIHQYLDDWLVRARSHQVCLQHTQDLVKMCQQLDKSELEPKQVFNFVGYQSGSAIHVLDRFTNSHRKASSPRPTTYETIETHTVASQEQLEGSGITRKGNPNSQFPASPLTMMDRCRQCTHRPTITPNKSCSANVYRCIKRRVGAHLNEHTARGTWSFPESKLHINYLELKAVFLALKEFQDLRSDKIVLVATDNTTVVSYINKEGGMRSGPLCALIWRILTWCTRKQVTLKARHIPG